MKHFILSIAAAVLFTAHSFAGNTESVTPAVRLHFEKEFGKQTKVTWSKKDEIYTASFEQDGKTIHAFYDQDGEFLGMGQYSSAKQIPLGIQRVLEERFPESIIHQTYEFSPENGGIIYGFLISDQRKVRVVKIGTYGDIEVVKSTRKNNIR
jgi:hypothetical protein